MCENVRNNPSVMNQKHLFRLHTLRADQSDVLVDKTDRRTITRSNNELFKLVSVRASPELSPLPSHWPSSWWAGPS